MASKQRIHHISFFVLLFVGFIFVAWLVKPFVNILALALILAVLFRPIYRLFHRRIQHNSIASLATLAVMVIVVALPLWLFGQLIYSEINELYDKYQSGAFILDKDQLISQVPTEIQGFLQSLNQDLSKFIGTATANIFSSASSLVSNVAGFFVSLFMLLFILYYMLRDGALMKKVLMEISPLDNSQEIKLFDRIVSAINGVVKGSFLIALVQGIIATIGFTIFGVPEPILWGMFTVMTALVPTVGTSISLVPAVILLAITGQMPQAVGMAIWGVVAVGLIDNFLGPKLIGSSTKLHPVLVLLAVIGGLKFFGILGFLIGPIIMAIFVAMVSMYREEYKKYLLN